MYQKLATPEEVHYAQGPKENAGMNKIDEMVRDGLITSLKAQKVRDYLRDLGPRENMGDIVYGIIDRLKDGTF